MKKISCIFLVVLLLITTSVPVLAAPATPSNFSLEDYLDNYKKIPLPADNPGLGYVPDAPVHTSSDSDVWIGDDGLPVAADVVPFSSVDGSHFANTVDRSALYVQLLYYDMSNNVKFASVPVSSDGHFNIVRPSDYVSAYYINFIIDKRALPSSGKWTMQFDYAANAGGSNNYKNCALSYNKLNNNANAQWSKQVPIPFSQNFGDVYLSSVVEVSSVTTSIYISLYPSDSFSINPYFNGDLKVAFTANNSSTPPAVDGFNPTSGEIEQQNSQNIDNISSGVGEMNDTLKEIVQTISKQLEALWNQQYNYIHLEDMANADKNADKIINNQTENTEQVTGAIEEHGNFIIEGLKRLFIPSDTFFKEYFDDLYNWFSEKFGFLTIPIDILVQVLDVFTTSQKVDFIVTLPPLSIMGEDVWPEQSFNFTDFMEKDFAFLITAVQTGTSILLILSFIDLCRKKYDEVMRN